MKDTVSLIQREVSRRRTVAIISHPDAGKTTLTEKLLLFGGCIDVAGAVRGRKTQRAATSDWMELEKQRGISVSSTVLAFEFDGYQINLLDTPGHHDFSEDTYLQRENPQVEFSPMRTRRVLPGAVSSSTSELADLGEIAR